MRQLETKLTDRTLRFDGVSILNLKQVPEVLVRGVHISKIRVTEPSEEVDQFNEQVIEAHRLRVNEPEPINIDLTWQLPSEYKNLDLVDRIFLDFEAALLRLDYDPIQEQQAAQRLTDELAEIETRGMTEFIRTIIYVLDTFRAKDVVWGVGRGSSCASYILFILGLHVVDCVRFDVPMEEFFHD